MWNYEKRLQFPVAIQHSDPAFANILITQLGGPDGELSAALRYMSQRYTMPYPQLKAMLTDIATEELAHVEIISAMVYQLTRNLTPTQIKEAGFAAYFVDHTTGIYPQAAAGFPHTAAFYQSKGDPIADLMEDMAAEQKARVVYDNLLRLASDEDVIKVLRFLRQREIVHFQRFGEALGILQNHLNPNNYYAFNPSFDMRKVKQTIPCFDQMSNQSNCLEDVPPYQ